MGHPLYKGATRAPTFLHVPLDVFLATIVVVVGIGLPLWPPLCLLIVPIYFVELLISKNDDKAFRVWWLYISLNVKRRITKGPDSYYSPNKYTD